MSRARVALCASMLLVLVAADAAPDSRMDMSTPESTISMYYDGYRRGDREMIESTFLEPRSVESTGLGEPVEYRIVGKKMVTDRIAPMDQPGDVQIEVVGKVHSARGGVVNFATTFFLRHVAPGWRIVGYASELMQP